MYRQAVTALCSLSRICTSLEIPTYKSVVLHSMMYKYHISIKQISRRFTPRDLRVLRPLRLDHLSENLQQNQNIYLEKIRGPRVLARGYFTLLTIFISLVPRRSCLPAGRSLLGIDCSRPTILGRSKSRPPSVSEGSEAVVRKLKIILNNINNLEFYNIIKVKLCH